MCVSELVGACMYDCVHDDCMLFLVCACMCMYICKMIDELVRVCEINVDNNEPL